MPRDDIKSEDGKPFVPGDPRINRKGRPPKLLTHLNEELKEQGYEPVTESQIIEAYLLLLNMDKNKIVEYVNNDSVPALFEIAAKSIGSKRGLEAVEKLLNRAIGKAQNKVDVTTGGEKIDNISFLTPSDENS